MRFFRRLSLLLLLGGVIAFGFNNCGQPGSIELTGSAIQESQSVVDEGIDEEEIDPPGTPITPGNPQPPIGPISYVTKTTTVEVSENENRQVDVLIVIDNSGSMSFEQKNMADRFSDFTSQLTGLDWRLAIVTTDVSSDNNLKDGRLIKFSDMNNATFLDAKMDVQKVKAAFAKAIQRSEVGSSREQGIAASYRAVERSQESNSSISLPNKNFFRSTAILNIIVITDSNETPPKSGATIRNSPEELLKKIKSVWQQKTVVFHSIIVQSSDSKCLSINGNEKYGVSYEKASELTNGIVGSVCDNDYSQQLSLMGQVTRNSVNTITLECAPEDADQNGSVDLEIKNPSGQIIDRGFILKGAQIVFDQNLPLGKTTATYKCVANGS